MKVGDLVRIRLGVLDDLEVTWPEVIGQVGVIIKEVHRLYIPAAVVMVLGEQAEFDLSELELAS
jgi:hypothetical protein|tara:strand:+ start:665 stop:856 length:192 start_codon:yes stop_codon:yes gene_type:complete